MARRLRWSWPLVLPVLVAAAAVPLETAYAAESSITKSSFRGSPLERARASHPRAPVRTSLVTPPQPPVVPAAQTSRAPASLPTDCSRDVSSELNAWLTALPTSGVRVVFPTNGCYRTERTITVKGKKGWVVDGQGVELRRTEQTPAELRYPKNNRHLAVVDSTDVVVRNFRVTGLNTVSDVPKQPHFGSYVRDLEFEHAYSAWNSSRLEFEDLQADAPFGDGLYLHSNVRDVTVRRVDLARNGRQGIGVLATRVLIDSANLRSSRRAGVDLEPDKAPLMDVEVRNSTILSHLLAIASGGPGNVDRIHVHHNTVVKSGVPWLYAARAGFTRNDWTVTDNWVQPYLGSPAAAMRFQNAERAVVTRNIVPVVTTQSRLIFDVASSTVTATCNSFRGGGTLVRDLDGRSTVHLIANETGPEPPACLDTNAVGAPRKQEPVRTSNDWFSGATAVSPLAPGMRSQALPVNNRSYTYEQFEPATTGKSGRSAWFRYRTGPRPETMTLRTTGALRSIKIIAGNDLYWHTPVSQHPSTAQLTSRLAANTTYSIQLDDSTSYTGADVARTVVFVRDA